MKGRRFRQRMENSAPRPGETLLPCVVIAAHGNSLRALVKYFDKLSNEEIIGVNIPTAVPLVYEFDDDFNVIKHYYLGDQSAIRAKMQAVANQGKKK